MSAGSTLSLETEQMMAQSTPRASRVTGAGSGAGETIISVRGLCNRFGTQCVHEHLDLDVTRGEILGVVGGSGSGKSVLLRSLVGLREPTSGSISVFGARIQALAPEARTQIERRMGVLFQRGALFSSLSVLENVALPLIEHAGLSRAEAEHLAEVKLVMVGLPPGTGPKAPASLSGGMIKRAALARALALDPEILFLDEPTAGLDPIGAAAFDRLIRTLRDALGLTVFLVTHDLDTLYEICDRVAVLSQRRVLVIGTLEEVAEMPDAWVQEYFHGPRGRAAATASHAGAVVHSARGTPGSSCTSSNDPAEPPGAVHPGNADRPFPTHSEQKN